MHSSTSSSERRWLLPLTAGLLIAALLFGLLETAVRMLGYQPGVRDGAPLWSLIRARANAPDALVLIGGSRILLNVDPAQLAALSGRSVVQLAIDGQSFQPVLQNLAADENFRGTVIVDALDQNLSATASAARARSWVAYWQTHGQQPSARSDAWLALQLQQVSAWYAAEPPWPEMFRRLAAGGVASNYLVTAPDRSRKADYGTARQQIDRYVSRVLRNYARPVDTSNIRNLGEFEAHFQALLKQESPVTLATFDQATEDTRRWVTQINSRGGRVIFVRMPSRGLIREIEEVRYPRALYWDRFVTATGVAALHFADEPALTEFRPPDGSHLDQRDVNRFTDQLYSALSRRGLL